MKKLLLTFLLATSLAGCATGPSGVDTQVQAALAYVRSACAYVPTIATLVAIFQQEGPFATGASVGAKVCAALEQNPMTEGIAGGRTVPKVDGVPIKGHFVK